MMKLVVLLFLTCCKHVISSSSSLRGQPEWMQQEDVEFDQSPRDLLPVDEGVCDIPIPFDASRHKEVYTVGVLAIRGFDAAFTEFNKTFNEYLTATAGQRFDPPIRFELKPLNFLTLFSDAEQKLVDYIYVNPSAYSCIESEYDANSLASQVSRRNVGGEVYNLKKFGGVIATLADRDDIQTIQDLKDQVIAAASISGLGSGQMQFKEMVHNRMNYLQDPKQLVFTSNQGLVVKGLLNGDFDVGFVRTDQLERSKDADGNPVDLSRFKIIDPKANLTIDGEPFPFQSSTELYAEWNIAALTHVATDVSREVQRAMLSVADFSKVGEPIVQCYAEHNATYCDEIDLQDFVPETPIRCDTTRAKAVIAYEAKEAGKFTAWTTSLSYMQLRSMQEATGFIEMEEPTKIWRCVRSAELYDAISCSGGFRKKTKEEVAVGCAELGLECAEGFQCVCQPCEQPYELVCVDSVKIGDGCVSLAIFLPSIILPILVLVGVLVHFYVEHKRKQADSVWVVKPKELMFDDPPTVIGRGTFGLVLLAEYRGTQVAVKRVIPPGTSSSNSLFDVSVTASRSSHSTGFDSDLETGLKSMHPGFKSMATKAVKKALVRTNSTSAVGAVGAVGTAHQSISLADVTSQKKSPCCFWSNGEEHSHSRLKSEFVFEIRLLAKLRHPCITTVMGAVMPTRGDEPMLVMEYMSHGSLYDVLQNDTITLKPEQILAILQDVAQGLRFLHSATPLVVHGDLKSQNVLIDTNFCAKVADFGLSGKKQIGAVGTPYWMAPELLKGETTNMAASDVYAYGIVISEIFSGRPPYEGERYDEVMRQVCDPLIKKRPPLPLKCPPKVAVLMTDCLMHAPHERPSAEQLDLVLKVELKVKERTTRLEALNRDLEEANHKIASASAMQLQHFAIMSHEIRTPLNCIIGLSSLLEETDLNPMQKENMEMIVSSGRLLRQIVDDVLDYSKLESGNAEVLIKNINLQETLNAVVHLIKTSRVTEEKKLNIMTIYEPTLPEFICTDNRRIQQILYNLLGNAIKFSKEQGKVEFGVHIADGVISFSVKDYGKGIDQKDFGKIFEPFRQTGTGLTNAEGGTGLGLAITKKLVEALGGQISVVSDVGNWTKFTVDFPFTNKLVDIEELSLRLRETTIFLVSDENSVDTKGMEAVFSRFMVDYAHFPTMRDLARVIATEGALSEDGTYVCMVQEDLYDKETYELLTGNARACLVTFGPNFTVEKCLRHYRSLVETFPSVLIQNLGVFAQDLTRDPQRDCSVKSTGTFNNELGALRVLIAEDNLVNQKVLTRILNRLNVTSIAVVGNGLEAVEREAVEEFDLILMDMQMPKMDGIEACIEINQRTGGHPRAKIVFVTAHVSDSFRQTCLENGAFGYLPKPCTLEGVSEVLRHAMGQGSLFSPVYTASWNQNTAPPTS